MRTGLIEVPLGITLREVVFDVAGGNRAIGADEVGIGFRHFQENRTADFHRVGEKFAFHAPGTVMTGAALDGVDLRIRD